MLQFNPQTLRLDAMRSPMPITEGALVQEFTYTHDAHIVGFFELEPAQVQALCAEGGPAQENVEFAGLLVDSAGEGALIYKEFARENVEGAKRELVQKYIENLKKIDTLQNCDVIVHN